LEQVFDTKGLFWSSSKLGIRLIPRLPDVKPPCLTRRACWPGVFLSGTRPRRGRNAAGCG